MNGAKKILFLLRQPPYATSHALEALEAALVAGVFEQEVSVLFKDAGVWQLLSDQSGDVLATRTIGKIVTALPEYDIDSLYVCAESLAERHLTVQDLVLPVTVVSVAAQGDLINAMNAVVND
jgi:tRNA 2-thiouridine synthesizing protein C